MLRTGMLFKMKLCLKDGSPEGYSPWCDCTSLSKIVQLDQSVTNSSEPRYKAGA